MQLNADPEAEAKGKRAGIGPGQTTDAYLTLQKGREQNGGRRHPCPYVTTSSGREGGSVFPRKMGDVALGRGIPASNPEIGPGYVDYGSFTDVEQQKTMRMLGLREPEQIER